MPKRFLEDMVKAKRQNRGLKELQKESRETREQSSKILERGVRETDESRETTVNYSPKRSRYLLWFVALISVFFLFFALSFLFGKAEIRVSPKTEDIFLNENLSASKDSNTGNLSFNLVIVPNKESKIIQAAGEKDVAIKATGTVCIFNTFSSSSQKLNIDTRLEGSNGKIYKTQKEITVPGMNKSGTSVCPVEVGIYATEAGVEYNGAPLDFYILGFKGTPKYSKFKVRSKTGTEITGGFIGKIPAVSDTDKTTAINDLKTILQTKLLQQATEQIPSGFVLFKSAVIFNDSDPNIFSVSDKDNSATLTLQGTLYGVILNEQELTKKIITDNLTDYDGSDVFISNIKDLTFSLPAGQPDLSSVQNIDFNLSGSAKIVWKLDVNKFTDSLLGKSKKDFNQILSQYPDVSSATLMLSPIWKMSIPDQTQNIKVIVNYPTAS